jgi:predicted transcriptional regulator
MAEPDRKSVFDMPPDNATEAGLDSAAEAEIDAGKGVPHEKVREWLARLGKGHRIPPPTA